MGRELGYSGAELQTFVKEEKAEIRQREEKRTRKRRKRKRTGRKKTEKRSRGTRETSSTSACKNKCRNRDFTRK